MKEHYVYITVQIHFREMSVQHIAPFHGRATEVTQSVPCNFVHLRGVIVPFFCHHILRAHHGPLR